MTLTGTVPAVKTVFVHIPKTAGTAFRQVLSSTMSLQIVARPEAFVMARMRSNELGPSDARWLLERLDECDCAAGHVPYHMWMQLFPGPDVRYVTWLREPQARVLSLYYFLRAYRLPLLHPCSDWDTIHIAKSHSLAEFLRHSAPGIREIVDNAMVRMLSPYCPPNLYSPHLTRSQVQGALANLSSFTAFGLVARPKESLEHISAALGVALPPMLQENVLAERERSDRFFEPIPREEPTQESAELLHACTVYDQQLYDHAFQLFDKF
jgi:hypothetical protein